MQSRISRHPPSPRGFTLLEALVAVLVVAMVAAAGAVGIGVAAASHEEARIAQVALQAAEQQINYLLEQPFAQMQAHAGEEAVGAILAPPPAGAVDRTSFLTHDWSRLGRRTTLLDEPLTFPTYGDVTLPGTRIEVEVFGVDGTVYASLRRHRTLESSL